MTDRPSTLGLMIRPAARIIRELPPRRRSYRVAVFFRAAPLAAPAVVRSTEGVESTDEKKPLATAIPVETLPNIPPTRVFGKAEIACVSGLCLCCFRRQQLQCITAFWSLQDKIANVLRDKPLHPIQGGIPHYGGYPITGYTLRRSVSVTLNR